MTRHRITVEGYEIATDVRYERETHLWVAPTAKKGVFRVGFDPLGRETCGDIVAISFEPNGTALTRGAAFGTMEAAKFVGPLLAPVTGTIRTHNEDVIRDPGRLAREPYAHWMIEIETTDAAELDDLLNVESDLRAWFEADVRRFRDKGMIAE